MITGTPLPPTGTHFITIEKAKELTGLYREKKNRLLTENYQDTDTLPTSETFNRDIFDAILKQKDCAGIRLYFGMDDEMRIKLIIVGVNEQNRDILPSVYNNWEGIIGEEGTLCPPLCVPSALNERRLEIFLAN